MKSLAEYLKTLHSALEEIDPTAFEAVVAEVRRVYVDDRTLFTCGNGGSAGTASHMVNDLVKGVAWDYDADCLCKPIKAVGLADCVPLMTALANDIGYDRMFSAQLTALGQSGDALVAFSGSGNSPNVVNAAKVAREKGITVIAMTGYDGGKLGKLADIHLHVPCNSMPHVEDAHLVVEHALVEALKNALRPKSEATA